MGQRQATNSGRKIDQSAAQADQAAEAQAHQEFTQGVLKTPLPAGSKVTYGAGRKVSDGNYGSFDFHCSISLESDGTQTPEELVKRGIAFAETVLGAKTRAAASKKLNY